MSLTILNTRQKPKRAVSITSPKFKIHIHPDEEDSVVLCGNLGYVASVEVSFALTSSWQKGDCKTCWRLLSNASV